MAPAVHLAHRTSTSCSSSSSDLLPANSPSLILAHPTATELLSIWTETAAAWGKHLSRDAYIERESACKLTTRARGGGITHWVLVSSRDGSLEHERIIYATCETLRQTVCVVKKGQQRFEEVIAHCVGSVWCSPHLRGRGFASRMIRDLGAVLETWQEDHGEVACSVLYSDIGKRWYARYGWQPFDSRHIDFHVAAAAAERSPYSQKPDLKATMHAQIQMVWPLALEDLRSLCAEDSARLKKQLLASSEPEWSRLVFVPTFEIVEWFCTREDVTMQYLLGRLTNLKGVMTGPSNARVWAAFYRAYTGPLQSQSGPMASSSNILYILRLVVENPAATDANVASFTAIMEVAQAVARDCSLDSVQMWNPSAVVLDIIEHSKVEHTKVVREVESIPCLKMYGSTNDKVEWMALEKYCWC